MLLRKKFWIRLNPRFSVPRRNLENSTKTPPFCFPTEFEETGSSGPRKVESLWSSHFLHDGAIHIRKVRRNAFQKCCQLFQQYPRLKERYTVQFTGDYRSVVQNRTETSEARSVRTIEELSLELVPQTSKSYFQNFLLEANQQFATDNLYLPIPQKL